MRIEIIDSGAFRTEFLLQQATVTHDGMGGHTETWTVVASLFARLEPIAARTRFAADQTTETVTHRITMRARSDVRSGMRLVRGDRVFEIVTAHDPDETGRYLTCMSQETGL